MAEATQLVKAFAWVDAAYAALERGSNFVARETQVRLSKEIAQSFLDKTALAAEAPTGTGKTLAYLVGALSCYRTQGEGVKTPVVVSTATKALQEQLLRADVPRLVAAGLLQESEVTLAKGKSNYLCHHHAYQTLGMLQMSLGDPETVLFPGAEQVDDVVLEQMLGAFDEESWDGDFDNYPRSIGFKTFPIAVNQDTCLRRKCESYSKCAYTRARSKITGCAILVVNHDLLLRDLLQSADGIEGTLPVQNYNLVVDEAHHLPEKAIEVGSREFSISALALALPKLTGAHKTLDSSADLLRVLQAQNLTLNAVDREAVQLALKVLIDTLARYPVEDDSFQRRFAAGVVPPDVKEALELCSPLLLRMEEVTSKILSAVRDAKELPPAAKGAAADVVNRLVDLRRLAEGAIRCIRAYGKSQNYALWLFRKGGGLSLHAAPLEGAEVLKPILWASPRARATVMVSATLQDFGGFARYRQKTGMPESGKTLALPSPFPYEKSSLVVAALKASPKPAERKLFCAELSRVLPEHLDVKEASLVLFPSWSMLREFAPQLKKRYGENFVRVQGDAPLTVLLRGHCAAVDAGQGAILTGVATLSEGLDLPGAYCTHVVVVALPFAAPTDPVEQELADKLGSRYFNERALPDALVRLTQMVGRLLRRESDKGRITILDHRLGSTSYGRKMLQALPPFQKQVLTATSTRHETFSRPGTAVSLEESPSLQGGEDVKTATSPRPAAAALEAPQTAALF